MKRIYKLKVMYAATKQYAFQTYEKEVKADRMYIDKGGAYVFETMKCVIIACYPTQYTIIESITEIDETS